jgi:hypothetical protein
MAAAEARQAQRDLKWIERLGGRACWAYGMSNI